MMNSYASATAIRAIVGMTHMAIQTTEEMLK